MWAYVCMCSFKNRLQKTIKAIYRKGGTTAQWVIKILIKK